MLTLPKYLICNNKEALPGGAGLLLCTEWPFYYGRIWLFTSIEEYNKYLTIWVNSMQPIIKSKLDGYWIVVTIEGSLQNDSNAPGKGNLQAIADGMAQLYFDERVSQKTGYYKKYLER